MKDHGTLLKYTQEAINQLLEQGHFDGGQEFRKTQRQALEAYKRFLHSDKLPEEERLKGFFEMPTGIGKTAVFIGIISGIQKIAREDDQELKIIIVEPTNQLQGQTADAFQDFSPALKDEIGFFGDGYKDLTCPITIMTYDAWYDLTYANVIGSHNIDIQISDEAHHGTSERRIENISDAFNGNTLQLAFTATSRYDEEKSVELTHEHEIFSKDPATSVREGELAPYIQSQRRIIRVAPDEFMQSETFSNWSSIRQTNYRRRARQKAWNERAVKLFRDGVDKRTGDPVTDNQAGFFTAGIEQAEQLEALLKKDPELRKRAKEQGREGVAVTVHSRLMPAERDQILEDHANGKYMAIISADMLKEGFDYPPMKTIIDYPHGSVVDKAQIIGRGARQWWNEKKARFEGLTIMDTVIYMGSDDPEEDAKLRRNALGWSVSVKQILGADYVFGPGAPSSDNNFDIDANTTTHVFEDDPNVEEYTTFDELYEIESEAAEAERILSLIGEGDGNKRRLTFQGIIEAIDGYREINDKNPNAYPANPEDTETNVVGHGDLGDVNWYIITRSLKEGYNGLKDDPEWQEWRDEQKKNGNNASLATLLVTLGYKGQPLIMTMANVKEAIDLYREHNKNQNPSNTSGSVNYGELKNKATWYGIGGSLIYGYNGLDEDPEWQEWSEELKAQGKNTTLHQYLLKLGYKGAEVELTMPLLKEAVDDYRAKNNGQNPPNNKTPVEYSGIDGKLSWRAIGLALENGRFGLDKDDTWKAWNDELKAKKKKLSLKNYFVKLGYAEQKGKMTMALIKASIDAYMEANDGNTPKNSLDPIDVGPLTGTGATFDSLNGNLKQGTRGLKDDPEWKAWSEEVKAKGKPLTLTQYMISLGYKEEPLVLTMKDIEESMDAYRRDPKNKMKPPSQVAGPVEHGPLAGKVDWQVVGVALEKGNNGLDRDLAYAPWVAKLKKNGIKPSLSEYSVTLGYKIKRYTLAMVEDAVNEHRAENNDGNPSIGDKGKIQYGIFKNLVTWGAVSTALKNGSNELKNDPAYIAWKKELKAQGKEPSLSQFLIRLGYAEEKIDLTVAFIKEAMGLHHKEHGKYPHASTREPIKKGSLAGDTWNSIGAAIAAVPGLRGLKDDPEYAEWVADLKKQKRKKPTLSQFAVSFFDKAEVLPLTLAEIKNSILAHTEKNFGIPPVNNTKSGKIKFGSLAGKTTWVAVGAAMRDGFNNLKEDSEYVKWVDSLKTEGKNPSFNQYLITLGLAEAPLVISMSGVKETITAYRAANDNADPSLSHEFIMVGPYAQKLRWNTLNTYLSNGKGNWDSTDELEEYKARNGGKFSLVKLCKEIPFSSKGSHRTPSGP